MGVADTCIERKPNTKTRQAHEENSFLRVLCVLRVSGLLLHCSRLDQAIQLGLERLAIESQPIALFAPVRHELFDQRPEARRVAADAQVTQFVHDHVAQRRGRRER